MSRLALYRKWRPMTFRDVVEQRHVVETLRNALKTDAVGHAYLFCGTRGTGKTTMAKIFARAINCLDPQDGDPCNVCSVCKGILEGSILDVMEMDAASNNSVDNIRDIRDEVIYAPAVARYKVYIIDEVHMLSQGAFNALLKTLEEPPDRVVFILATTEPQKLPATVLSRCQRFDFKRITEQGIAERLGEIAIDCGISVTPAALQFLARLAGGALRDAISLLDQLTTLGRAQIDIQDVNEMAGFASNAAIRQLAGALLSGDIAASWTVLDTLMREGRDLSQLCVQLLSWFRNALLLQLGGDASPLLDLHPDDLEDARLVASTLGSAELSAWLRELSEHELRLRRTDNPRIMMEVLLLRLCTRTTGKSGAASTALANEPGSTGKTAVSAGTAPIPAGKASATDMNGSAAAVAGLEARLVRMERKLAEWSSAPPPSASAASPVNKSLVDVTPSSANMAPSSGTYGSASRASMSGPTTVSTASEAAGLMEAVGEATGETAKATAKATAQHAIASDGVMPFTAWPRVIDEVRRLGPSRPGGMKLFAYLLDTECLQLPDQQLRVVVSADDFLKRKVLAQSDSLEMMIEAVLAVTGETWHLRVIDTKEAGTLKTGTSHRKVKSQPRSPEEQASPSHDARISESEPPGTPEAGEATENSQTEPVTTGDEALDKLMLFSRETGIPIQVADEPEDKGEAGDS